VKVMNIDDVDFASEPLAANDSIPTIVLEVQILLQLKGYKANNVNQMLDIRQVHNQIWLIMELVSGGSVRTLVSGSRDSVIASAFPAASNCFCQLWQLSLSYRDCALSPLHSSHC